jgi:hypothetical protein
LVLAAARGVAPAGTAAAPVVKRVGREIVKQEGSDPMFCTDAFEDRDKLPDDRPNAYMIMIGPFNAKRTYKKWMYAALALTSALAAHGSDADVVVLMAQNGGAGVNALPDEEALLSRNGIHWRYVSAPYGNSGFHMGHFKVWAWQHTEYARIQLLDADLLPLVNMDRFFDFGAALDSDFVGCPGKLSVLNAGWFVLRPSCLHFEAMTQILKGDGHGGSATWSSEYGWGHKLPYWLSSEGVTMKSGWDFFDAHGNQGHMYSYFLFEAKDLTLIYADSVKAYGNGSLAGEESVLDLMASHGDVAGAAALKQQLYSAYPCPFPLKVKERAYVHFTGNLKPWTKHAPTNPQFQLWYDAVTRSGDVDLSRDIFAV